MKIALKSRNTNAFAILGYLRLARQKARLKAKSEKQKLKLLHRREDREDAKLRFIIDMHLNTLCDQMLSAAGRRQADEINARNDLTRAEKIAAMRKAAFADVDEYLKSGKLVLPE